MFIASIMWKVLTKTSQICPFSPLYLTLSNVVIHNSFTSKFSFPPQIAGLMDCRSEMANSQKEDTNSDGNGHLFDVLGKQ